VILYFVNCPGIHICLKLKHQLTTGGNDITGCSILTGGKMVFINFHPVYLLILNVDGLTKVMSHGVIEVVTSPKQCTSVVKVFND
jgi:hypothetical protein